MDVFTASSDRRPGAKGRIADHALNGYVKTINAYNATDAPFVIHMEVVYVDIAGANIHKLAASYAIDFSTVHFCSPPLPPQKLFCSIYYNQKS